MRLNGCNPGSCFGYSLTNRQKFAILGNCRLLWRSRRFIPLFFEMRYYNQSIFSRLLVHPSFFHLGLFPFFSFRGSLTTNLQLKSVFRIRPKFSMQSFL